MSIEISSVHAAALFHMFEWLTHSMYFRMSSSGHLRYTKSGYSVKSVFDAYDRLLKDQWPGRVDLWVFSLFVFWLGKRSFHVQLVISDATEMCKWCNGREIFPALEWSRLGCLFQISWCYVHKICRLVIADPKILPYFAPFFRSVDLFWPKNIGR